MSNKKIRKTENLMNFRNALINRMWSFHNMPKEVSKLLLDDPVDWMFKAIEIYSKEKEN